jgi:hypothetical protein
VRFFFCFSYFTLITALQAPCPDLAGTGLYGGPHPFEIHLLPYSPFEKQGLQTGGPCFSYRNAFFMIS